MSNDAMKAKSRYLDIINACLGIPDDELIDTCAGLYDIDNPRCLRTLGIIGNSWASYRSPFYNGPTNYEHQVHDQAVLLGIASGAILIDSGSVPREGLVGISSAASNSMFNLVGSSVYRLVEANGTIFREDPEPKIADNNTLPAVYLFGLENIAAN